MTRPFDCEKIQGGLFSQLKAYLQNNCPANPSHFRQKVYLFIKGQFRFLIGTLKAKRNRGGAMTMDAGTGLTLAEGAVKLLNGLIDTVAKIREKDSKKQTTEWRNVQADLSRGMAELKEKLLEVEEENRALKRKVRGNDFLSKLRRAFSIDPKEGFYVLGKTVSGYKPANYCTACFANEKPVPLIPFGSSGHKCPACDKRYFHGATIPAAVTVVHKPSWVNGWRGR